MTGTKTINQLHRRAVGMHTRVDSGSLYQQRYLLVQEKGPQETSDWKSEIRTWGGAGAGGSAELLASQAPQEDDDDDPEKVEDEEEPEEEDDDEPEEEDDDE